MSQLDVPAVKPSFGALAARALLHVVSKLKFEIFYYFVYADIFGVTRGSLLFATSRLRPKSTGGRITIPLPGTDVPLTIRPYSSDIIVFREIFTNLEYAWAFAAAPSVIVDAGGYTGL